MLMDIVQYKLEITKYLIKKVKRLAEIVLFQ
jgi:hypothetical protein